MRVKVGDKWFECRKGQPIMIELTTADKRNLAGMPPEATRYAVFDDAEPWGAEEKRSWMDEGASDLG